MEIGDIVQINPNEDGWGGCLLIVSEVKSWGVQGYVDVPKTGQAYYRVKNDDFVKVGKAEWIVE